MLKRSIDLTLSCLALVALSPVLIAAAVAIRITMGAPVLFRDQRAGRGGAPFAMYKFRTMRELRDGETIPEHDAIRVTRVGRILRATSVDELPSLLNIAKGDMSIVGPRPLPVRYTERYTPQQARRLEVRPGLTGLAQSSGRNEMTWERRFELDVEYVDGHDLVLDARIIAATIAPVLKRSGIDTEEQAAMPEFWGTQGPPDAAD